jgi:pyruvate-formate lyase-activating enzyme
MLPRPKIALEIRAAVRERARLRCEYCHALETWQYVEFTLEHVVPLSAGGQSTLDNLALACFACNRRKWDHREGRDPRTDDAARLFNPRIDTWNDHFAWSSDGLEIVGLTAIGRTTVVTLELSRERAVRIREADAVLGRHPPDEDRRVT